MQHEARAHIVERGAFTGMIFCPWKKCDIAIMRCAEFQAVCCGCASRPSDNDLAALKKAMESAPQDVEHASRLRSYYRLVQSDQRFGFCACGKVAVYRKTRECSACYGARMYLRTKNRRERRHG